MTFPVLSARRAAAALTGIGLVTSAALVTSSAASSADQNYYVPVSKVWTVNGHGYGHGHGMSQYGAYGAALRGLDYKQIVDFYYPKTSWSTSKGKVRVLLSADTSSDLVVRPQRRLQVHDLADGTTWQLPTDGAIDLWRLTPAPDGTTAVQFHDARGWHRWRVPGRRVTLASDGQFQAAGPLTLMVPGGSSLAPKRYRGVLRSVRPYRGATSRDTVNVLPMDAYVQGVVPYEMPTSWHQQALRAQSVVARTYAAWQRAQNPKRYYQICDTTSCQVYGGIASEQASSNRAVRATARKILTWDRKPAFTQFSASSGGWTSAGSVPYLRALRDPYDAHAANSVHNWSVRVKASSLERAHPEVGRLVALRVTKRERNGQWGGRVLQVVLEGTAGKAYLTGDDIRWELGLRSTWFSVEPTPIIERWMRLGGRKSLLGTPSSGEYAVGNGAAQEFTGGRVFWTDAVGARELRGRLLRAYRAHGGPTSNLRWPVSGVLDASNGGYKARFQGGLIYAKSGPGAHVVRGRILDKWASYHYAGGQFGYPTTDVHAVKGGQRVRFQGGTIIWHRATDTFTVKRR